ncbi:MAG: ankyrin repeat domain-containing protein [Treponema sp.]|nr:ankyrin repeat domain-containing protein [Treponema sp.]
MNWLIITTDNASTIKDALVSCDASAPIFYCEAYHNTINFSAIYTTLNQITHCIAIFPKDHNHGENSAFTLGYLVGKEIPIYTTVSTLKNLSQISLPENIHLFDNEKELLTYITNNYSLIKQNQKIQEAKKYLFEKGFSFSEDGFAFCVSKGMVEVCRKYITGGMSVNVRDWRGTPLLNIAVRKGMIDCAAFLINNGADVNAVSLDRGYTPLMDAVWSGSEDFVKLLLQNGAKTNIVNKDGQTMLILAVGARRKNICKFLVEAGEDPDIKDGMGMSAYEYAKLFKHEEIVSILEKYHKR